MSKKITIYTSNNCPFCVKAKILLQNKNLSFDEVKINSDEAREELIKKTGGKRTVPQIFLDDRYIGDCSHIYQLEENGEFDNIFK